MGVSLVSKVGTSTLANTPAGERFKIWEDYISYRFIGTRPFTQLLSRLNKVKVNGVEFNHWEKELTYKIVYAVGGTDNLGGGIFGYSASATAIKFSNTPNGSPNSALELIKGKVLRSEVTKERLWVSANPTVASDPVSVIRGTGAVGATNIPNGTKFKIVGNAYPENDISPIPQYTAPASKTNFCQIFKQSFGISNTLLSTIAGQEDLKIKGIWRDKKREALFHFTKEIELAFFFGEKGEVNIAGYSEPLRFTDGIITFIESNTTGENIFDCNTEGAANGTLSEANLDKTLEAIFRYESGDVKQAFCGNTALLVLNQLVKDKYRIIPQPVTTEYGVNVLSYVLPFGTIELIPHPLFNEDASYRGHLLVVDMDNLAYCYLRPVEKIESGAQETDRDGLKGYFLTECGLQVKHADLHGLIKNIQAPA